MLNSSGFSLLTIFLQQGKEGSFFLLGHGESGVSQWSCAVQEAVGWDQSGHEDQHGFAVAMFHPAELTSFKLKVAWLSCEPFLGRLKGGAWMKGRTREIPSVAAKDKQQQNQPYHCPQGQKVHTRCDQTGYVHTLQHFGLELISALWSAQGSGNRINSECFFPGLLGYCCKTVEVTKASLVSATFGSSPWR